MEKESVFNLLLVGEKFGYCLVLFVLCCGMVKLKVQVCVDCGKRIEF